MHQKVAIICLCVCAHTQTNRCTYMLIHMYICTYVCIYVYMYVYMYICMYICIYVHICICICICICIRIYVYTYTYICICTNVHCSSLKGRNKKTNHIEFIVDVRVVLVLSKFLRKFIVIIEWRELEFVIHGLII